MDDLLRARWIIRISENEMAINSTRDHLKVTLNPLAKKAEQVISLYGNSDGPKIKVIIMDIITIQKSLLKTTTENGRRSCRECAC